MSAWWRNLTGRGTSPSIWHASCFWLFGEIIRRQLWTQKTATWAHEKNRSHHQTLQARRSEGGPSRGRHQGHYSDRGQGLWTPERPHRTLPRSGIRRGFPAQGENRGGGGR